HGLRYPSDLNDREWALIEPAIPPAKHGGRRREGERPRGSERDLLRALDGLPVAGVTEGSAAEKHRAFLFHAVGLGRHVKDARRARRLRSSTARAPRLL